MEEACLSSFMGTPRIAVLREARVAVPPGPDEGVVMAAEASPSPEYRIVVGVDGSVPSKAALRWALRQARLTGAVVEAVTAWEFRVVYSYPAPVIGTVNFEELATSVVQDAIAEATPGAEVGRISYKVVEGNAAQRCSESRPAQTCWLSAAADMADSCKRCSVRPASSASTTPRARS
jgi:nucleotide-binding universal stress UspA family protein